MLKFKYYASNIQVHKIPVKFEVMTGSYLSIYRKNFTLPKFYFFKIHSKTFTNKFLCIYKYYFKKNVLYALYVSYISILEASSNGECIETTAGPASIVLIP